MLNKGLSPSALVPKKGPEEIIRKHIHWDMLIHDIIEFALACIPVHKEHGDYTPNHVGIEE